MRHVLEEPPQLQTAELHCHLILHYDAVVGQVLVQDLEAEEGCGW